MRPNLQETADLITFTGKILNGNLHFLRSGICEHSNCIQALKLTQSHQELGERLSLITVKLLTH